MPTTTKSKNPLKNDVARRLAGIKKLFTAAESKSTTKLFDAPDRGSGVPVVPEVDALEDITTFANVANAAEAAIMNAINAFGGYSEAQFDGDIKGAAAEVHADVRALTNVALALSPPSRAFYNKVLGGLIQVEGVASVPTDGSAVAYQPMRVSLQEMEQNDVVVSRKNGNGAGSVGGSNGSLPRPVARTVDETLHAYINSVWSLYIEAPTTGTTPINSIIVTVTPAVNDGTDALKAAFTAKYAHDARISDAIDALRSSLLTTTKPIWKADPGKDWKALQKAFRPLFEIVRDS